MFYSDLDMVYKSLFVKELIGIEIFMQLYTKNFVWML